MQDSEKIINIKTLPVDIKNKLPITILASKKESFYLSEFPSDIQYILYDYIQNQPQTIKYSNAVRDLTPKVTMYNDLSPLNIKQTIIEYFRNYIYVEKGSYPFDVTFGTNIKKLLQTKDIKTIQTLLSNELQNIIISLTNDYHIPIKIIDANLIKNYSNTNDSTLMSEYMLQLIISVMNEQITINIS